MISHLNYLQIWIFVENGIDFIDYFLTDIIILILHVAFLYCFFLFLLLHVENRKISNFKNGSVCHFFILSTMFRN